MQSQAICYFFVDPTSVPLPLRNVLFPKVHRLQLPREFWYGESHVCGIANHRQICRQRLTENPLSALVKS